MITRSILTNFKLSSSSFCLLKSRKFGSSKEFSSMVKNVLANYKSTKIKNVFVLEKITKFDLEIQNGLTPNQILRNFPLAYKTHFIHKRIMESLINYLRKVYNLHVEVVKAQTKGILPFEGSNNKDRVRPDLLISAGGDGTFLEASSLIPPDQLNDNPIWLVGLNTDPERSLGSLCMSYFGPKNEQHFNCGYYDYEKCQPLSDEGNLNKDENDKSNYDKNLKDFCSYSYKRVPEKKIIFKNVNDPHDVKNEVLDEVNYHIISYDEYVKTLMDNVLNFKLHPIPRQRLRLKLFKRKLPIYSPLGSDDKNTEGLDTCIDSTKIEKVLLNTTSSAFDEDELNGQYYSKDPDNYCPPQGVMNDVMVADQDFGKTFYAIVQIDDKPIIRIKSSGVLITTGTGSTAWAYNVTKMNFFNGTSLIKCLLEHPKLLNLPLNVIDEQVIRETIECYNQKLKMDPSSSVMRCLIREGISNKTTVDKSFYNCKQVKVLPLSKNAVICVDGSKRIKLDYGDVLVLKTFECDLIWSLI